MSDWMGKSHSSKAAAAALVEHMMQWLEDRCVSDEGRELCISFFEEFMRIANREDK